LRSEELSPSRVFSTGSIWLFSVDSRFMFSYFIYIVMFKTTIPTANPLFIQRFSIGHPNHLSFASLGLLA
jgi:hypothetical protein